MLAAVLFSLVLLGAAWRLVHIWLYAGSTSIRAACIYSESSAWALDYEAVAAQLNESGLETAVCVTEDVLGKVRQLNVIANERGETMAQLALAWVLENPAITSVITGASRPEQIRQNVETVQKHVPLSDEEKAAIRAILEGRDE